MNPALDEMFHQSSFTLLPGLYRYVKANSLPKYGKHFMVSHDHAEITVVTEKENLKYLEIIEMNLNDWRLISLNLATPFMAGTLAAINTACAEKGMNNLVISTYSKDYLLVKDEQLEEIKTVLQGLGFKERE